MAVSLLLSTVSILPLELMSNVFVIDFHVSVIYISTIKNA